MIYIVIIQTYIMIKMPIVFEKSEGGINIEFIDNNEDSFVGYYNNSNIPKSFDNDIDGYFHQKTSSAKPTVKQAKVAADKIS